MVTYDMCAKALIDHLIIVDFIVNATKIVGIELSGFIYLEVPCKSYGKVTLHVLLDLTQQANAVNGLPESCRSMRGYEVARSKVITSLQSRGEGMVTMQKLNLLMVNEAEMGCGKVAKDQRLKVN